MGTAWRLPYVCVCQKFNTDWTSMRRKVLYNPPPTSCTPGEYVTVDCNICKCLPDGHIDEDHCTQNKCNNDEPKTRNLPMVIRRTEVPGSCEPNTWYSMGPCQFCFCSSKSKLVCNSEEPRGSIILGAYSFKVCGTGMGDEIKNLQKDKNNSKDSFVILPKHDLKSKEGGLRASNKFETEEPSNIIDNGPPKGKHTLKSSEETRDKDDRDDGDERDDRDEIDDREYRDESHKPDSNEHRYEKRKNDDNIDEDDDTKPTREKNDNDSTEDTKEKSRYKFDVDSEYRMKNNTNNKIKNKKYELNENSLLKTEPDELARHAKNKTIEVAALPGLLDKFLKMAIRKSLMSLSDTTAYCEPGSTWKVKCNSCYCLKNGKTMCTKIVCKNE